MSSNVRIKRGVLPASIGDIAVWQLIGFGLLFSASFFNLVALDSEKDVVKLDVQVYLKLAIVAGCGLYGGFGFLSDPRIQRIAFSLPVAFVLVLCGMCALASVFAFEPINAMVSSVSILCIYLMALTVSVSSGRVFAMKTIFWATGLFVFASWVIYFVAPGIGVMQEAIDGGEFVSRMSGLSHPNTLGQCAGICCLLGFCLYRNHEHRGILVLCVMLLAAAALVNSYSRSSMLATGFGLLAIYRHQMLNRSNLGKWWFVIVVLIAGLMVLSTQVDIAQTLREKSAVLSKSGDAEELATATGRSAIWAKTIELIGKRPLLGYGLTSSKNLLDDYSLYTHNLWLNVGLSCGLGGLLIAVLMFAWRFRMLFTFYSPLADAVFVFIVVNGLFENVIFSNLCGLPTICLVLTLSWFDLSDQESN